jgi:hypothetical protein
MVPGRNSTTPLENRGSEDAEFDPLTRVASEHTLAEKLLSDLGVILSEDDLSIAE